MLTTSRSLSDSTAHETVTKILTYVKGYGLPESKYLELLPNIDLYRLIFRYRNLEDTTDLAVLSKLLNFEDVAQLQVYVNALNNWLALIMKNNDWTNLVCPYCLVVSVVQREEEKVCQLCGSVIDNFDIESTDQSLNFGETFQPSSKMSFTDGLGNTLPKTQNHRLLINNDVKLSEFKKIRPDVAKELEAQKAANEKEVLAFSGDYCFRLSNGYVRRIPKTEISAQFNQLDLPLRTYKVGLNCESASIDLKYALTNAMPLCHKYGLGADQAFINTLGIEVRKILKVLTFLGLPKHRTPLVDTAFYLCLLHFKKKKIANDAKPFLKIDCNLVNLYSDFAFFKQDHKKPNYSPDSLLALEKLYFSSEA